MAGVTHSMVDSLDGMVSFMDSISNLPTDPPSLYVDLEGISLSRHGSISLLVIFVLPKNHVYFIDVHKLQAQAFTTAASADGTTTLKTILESARVTKVFFDVRNDSDALNHHFGIRLQGIEDVQLMENAGRPAGHRRYVNGLERCINTDAPISAQEKRVWKAAKDKGVGLFHPSKGGSYAVFNTRPVSNDIELYCMNDVRFLPQLRSLYLGRLAPGWKSKVTDETARRVEESQSPTYEPQSENKKFGPWEKPPVGHMGGLFWA